VYLPMNQPLKIVYISDFFPGISKKYAGAALIAYRTAKELSSRGHQVTIITTVDDANSTGWTEVEGMKVFRVYSKFPEWLKFYITIYNCQVSGKVKKVLAEIKPDICHFHNVHRILSFVLFKIARKYSRAVFLTAHDVMTIHYGKFYGYVTEDDLSKNPKINKKVKLSEQLRLAKKRFNPFRQLFVKYYLKYIDKVFAVSNELKDVLVANNVKNIEVLHNGIDIKQFQSVDQDIINKLKLKYKLGDKKIILFAGRISGAKGLENLIKALEIVFAKNEESVIAIVGKESKAKAILDDMNIEKYKNRIILTGWLDSEEMKAMYVLSYLFATPSIYLDPFPTVNLEAMASGLPVVGTCFGGTKELVIDNQTGFIVNPLNIEQLAEKILKLLSDDGLANKFGQNGIIRAEDKFTLDRQVEKLITTYNRYLS